MVYPSDQETTQNLKSSPTGNAKSRYGGFVVCEQSLQLTPPATNTFVSKFWNAVTLMKELILSKGQTSTAVSKADLNVSTVP